MKKLKVIAYDNMHAIRDNKDVEATHEDVELRFGDQSTLLDMTDEHYRLLAHQLERWFKVGHKPEARRKPGRPRKVSTRSRSAGGWPRPYYQTMLRDRGYTPEQIRDYLTQLRAWADSVERTAEYKLKKDGTSRPKGKLAYPRQLVDDYEKHLAFRAAHPMVAAGVLDGPLAGEEQRAAG